MTENGKATAGVAATQRTDTAEERPSCIDPDGTLHIHELTIPPSELWSSEFTEFYAKWVVQVSAPCAFPQSPPRSAPKAEWDKFDELNCAYHAECLARVLERYPVDVVDTQLAGVRVGIVSPKEGIAPKNRSRVLINLHAGGFVSNRGLVFGQIESIPVASIGQIKVITLDYRQAPFYGYPAASEDVEALYKELLEQYEPDAIGIFGCSAGAVLTAQVLVWLHAKGLPRPGAVGIFSSGPSPNWVCRKGDSGVWLLNIPRSTLSEADNAALEPIEWYMEDADLNDPKAYPESSDVELAKFPPTLLLSGTRDFTMSEAIVMHARLLKLGVDSSLYIMEGAPHAGHAIAVGTPEAHDAHAYVARWFDEHLAR